MGAVIEACNVVKVFGRDETPVLAGIDMRIARGQIVCIVGPSGCGKTTLLNLLAGFDRATSGDCRIDGMPITAPGPERGFVFQQATLYPWMKVWDNITLAARVAGRRRDEYETKARQLLEDTGLSGFADHYPYQLSGGMAQRAQLVRVLLAQPRVMLMDEPFGALDYQTRLAMQALLLDLCRVYRPTVVFITHDVDEAVFLADRVVVMSRRPGRIIEDITVEIVRPRQLQVLSTPQFGRYKVRILDLLGFR